MLQLTRQVIPTSITTLTRHPLTFFSGNVYIADTNNQRVRKVTVSTGIISTIAGTGTGTYSGDNGAATSASLYGPSGVALDASGITTSCVIFVIIVFILHNLGNVVIADQGNHRIRNVAVSTDIIATIAGSGCTGTYSGDNGAATAATLYRPYQVALDSSGIEHDHLLLTTFYSTFYLLGNVYIADSANNRIRKVTVSTDIITTIAGTGATSYGGDGGDATSATLHYPLGVSLDSSGIHPHTNT